MTRLLHNAVALVAAYAIALQALLSGAAPAAPAGLDPSAVICAADGSAGTPPPQHGRDCRDCPAVCGGTASGLAPAAVVFAPVDFAERTETPVFSIEALPPAPKHRRQASRAPPTGA